MKPRYFSPIIGVHKTIIGDVLVFFTNSKLTITGLAAGPIVTITDSVEPGKGDSTLNWYLISGAILGVGTIQRFIESFKISTFANFLLCLPF